MFKAFKTIRGKLTLFFTLIFGFTLLGFSIFLYNIFASQIRNDYDLVMTAFAASISENIRENGVNPEILLEIKELNKPGSALYNGYVMVLNSSEAVLIKSHQLENINIPLDKELINSSLNGKKEFTTKFLETSAGLWDQNGIRMLYYPAMHRGHKYILLLISPLSSPEQMLSSLRLILFITVPVTILLTGFMGWLFSKKAYEPVDKLVEKANTLTAEKLHERLVVDEVDDEISRLAGTLNDMIERLETSFKILKQFTSDASHELKTPLTIMKGEIEVALKKTRSLHEYKQVLADSLGEVNRLQNIVESLLLLSQYENKKIRLNFEDVNLNELVIEAVTKSHYITSKKNIKLIMHIDENIDSEILIKGDRQKLLNVFLNLIENAAKYSNENTEINLFLNHDEARKNAIVTICDQGIGMQDKVLSHIFDRFYRVDASRTRDENYSLGLGLAIVKATVEMHDGVVSVSSRINEGSVFKISLPLVKA
ncbi:MAG TPA: ATP-binding protein [Ignavibacteria bacterium]|jgi:heavy metal sensor kinase